MTCADGLVVPLGNCTGCADGIPRESVQTLTYEVLFTVDPVGHTVEFGFVQFGDTRPIATWTAGTIETITAVAGGWRVEIRTPLLGDGQAADGTGWWRVYARFPALDTGETPVIDLGGFLVL